MADSMLCSGNVMIDLLTAGGVQTGLRLQGNATSFELTTESEIKEQIGRGKATYGQVIATAIIPKPAKFKLTLNQLDKTNMILSNLGTGYDIAYSAETVTDEDVTCPSVLGYYVQLAKGHYSIKTGADAPVVKWASTVAIASVADYTGTVSGTVKMTTTGNHNLSTTSTVAIAGTTSYNSASIVATKVSATEFYVTDTYVASETGTVLRTYAETTDYTVDYTSGMIISTTTGGMIAGESLHVTYKTNNATGYYVEAMTNPTIRMRCFLDGLNYVNGKHVYVWAYDVQVRPTSGIDFLKDDFNEVTLEGTLLTPTGITHPYKIMVID